MPKRIGAQTPPKAVQAAFKHLREKGVLVAYAFYQDSEEFSWLYFNYNGQAVDFPPGCSIDILEHADAAVSCDRRPCLFVYKE
jgi:hypothetical protein